SCFDRFAPAEGRLLKDFFDGVAARAGRDPGPGNSPADAVGFMDRLVEHSRLNRRLADKDGAGDIGIVTADRSAVVEEKRVARLDPVVAGVAVALCRLGSGNHDRGKGQRFSAGGKELADEDRLDLAL